VADPVGLDGAAVGLVLFPLYISSVNAFIPFGVLALGVILFTLSPVAGRNAEGDDADEGEGAGPPAVEPAVHPSRRGPGRLVPHTA